MKKLKKENRVKLDKKLWMGTIRRRLLKNIGNRSMKIGEPLQEEREKTFHKETDGTVDTTLLSSGIGASWDLILDAVFIYDLQWLIF